MSWWANRKSRIGMSPIARKPPPFANGKAWWTSPPIAAPMPEYIEYVIGYQLELARTKPSDARNTMQKHVAEWLRTARRLLHEDMQTPERPDLQTTEGLLFGCFEALHKAKSLIVALGGTIPAEVEEVHSALNGRTAKIRRERAVAPLRMRRQA